MNFFTKIREHVLILLTDGKNKLNYKKGKFLNNDDIIHFVEK